jgi:hypothetical protein
MRLRQTSDLLGQTFVPARPTVFLAGGMKGFARQMPCLAGGMKGFARQMPCLAGQTFVPAGQTLVPAGKTKDFFLQKALFFRGFL